MRTTGQVSGPFKVGSLRELILTKTASFSLTILGTVNENNPLGGALAGGSLFLSAHNDCSTSRKEF